MKEWKGLFWEKKWELQRQQRRGLPSAVPYGRVPRALPNLCRKGAACFPHGDGGVSLCPLASASYFHSEEVQSSPWNRLCFWCPLLPGWNLEDWSAREKVCLQEQQKFQIHTSHSFLEETLLRGQPGKLLTVLIPMGKMFHRRNLRSRSKCDSRILEKSLRKNEGKLGLLGQFSIPWKRDHLWSSAWVL